MSGLTEAGQSHPGGFEPGRFNLSAWALKHQTLVVFFMLALAIAGAWSYVRLGRAEDPEFTIKTMVVTAVWPGATAREMELQVTDRIEKKLQELPYYDFTSSYAKPGETVIKVNLRQDTPARLVPDIWYQLRKKVGDIRQTLPPGVIGPFFNDEFGDTFGIMYAFSGDGFEDAELKAIAETVRQRLLSVPNVNKVDLFGVQDQKIFVELSHERLATLGITPAQIFDALQRENLVSPAGIVDTPTARIAVRVDSGLDTLEAVSAVPLVVNGRTLRIGDVATIRRGYEDPRATAMRVDGKPVVGLGIAMAKGGNIMTLGTAVDATMAKIERELPVGVEVTKIADQPRVVDTSITDFVRALAEALAIVLAVSFLSLGWRTGIVVALSVPLVLAITFLIMDMMGIYLHRISLGALIIALGLLVDDAIIAVEMMMVKLEEGFDRFRAASFAYASTAFPMLTGTLVTAAGFVPVGFAKSAAGEYTNAIFWVVGISLLVSWVVAVIFTPYLGYRLLPNPKSHAHGGTHADVYSGRIYRIIRSVVAWCVHHRWIVIGITVLSFVAALAGFRFVQQQFFPSSTRPELLIDLRLAEGSSYAATDAAARRVEALLADDPDVAYTVSYVGMGTPRFYLPLNPELKVVNYAQFMVMTKGAEPRERVFTRLSRAFEADFPELRGRVTKLENGPPVGYPVQFRVVGSDPVVIRQIAAQVRDAMRTNPDTVDVHFDWNELSKTVRLEVDQARVRALGVDPVALSDTLQTILSGVTITKVRDGTELIDVVARAIPEERLALSNLDNINIRTASGRTVALSQIAKVSYGLEEPVLWRRNRETVLTVRADVAPGVQPPTVTAALLPVLAPIKAALPDGYRIDTGGAVEESVKSQASIFAVMPVMVAIMVTVLMIQLQSFSRLIMVLLTAPLGMIGVSVFLLAFNQPFGFVALLGVIALAGMIMRNSVILVDQIDQDIQAGHSPYEAVIGAAVRRARPIALTAAAAILAMIPLSLSMFWGPMAVAIMGGLTVATLLTLLFLPALFAAWTRVVVPASGPASGPASRPASDNAAIRTRKRLAVSAAGTPG